MSCEHLNERLGSNKDVGVLLEETGSEIQRIANVHIDELQELIAGRDFALSKFPRTLTVLKDIDSSLGQIIELSDDVCGAHSLKTKLNSLENSLVVLQRAEKLLQTAKDFDKNVHALEQMRDRVKETCAAGEATAAITLFVQGIPLLNWWHHCYTDKGAVATLGLWRFPKVHRAEEELKTTIEGLIRDNLVLMIERDCGPIKKLLQALPECPSIGGRFDQLLLETLLGHFISVCTHNPFVAEGVRNTLEDILNLPLRRELIQSLITKLLSHVVVRNCAQDISLIQSTLIAAMVTIQKHDSLMDPGCDASESDTEETKAYEDDCIIVDWKSLRTQHALRMKGESKTGGETGAPETNADLNTKGGQDWIRLTVAFNQRLFLRNFEASLQQFPLTITATLHAIQNAHKSGANAPKSSLGTSQSPGTIYGRNMNNGGANSVKYLSNLFTKELPNVVNSISNLGDLAATLDFDELRPGLEDILNKMISDIEKNVFHTWNTTFQDDFVGGLEFLRMLYHIEHEILPGIAQALTSFQEPNEMDILAQVIPNLTAIVKLAESVCRNSVRCEYVDILRLFPGQDKNKGPTPAEQAASFTMDMFRLLFEDASEEAYVEKTILLYILLDLLTSYDNFIRKLPEDADHATVHDGIYAILSLVDSLLIDDFEESKEETLRMYKQLYSVASKLNCPTTLDKLQYHPSDLELQNLVPYRFLPFVDGVE
ncbi:hypothetical protein GNI_184050 [Gregarina niphandrodes]|uniref:Uncharacterized protein n=1 Tax=Gregarina niphandrodes TaxID=110365 RepID=A0A023AWS9_GRENI|nr:hypothetical protein GNI_184050 [Gregarina niphandrodes]EZG43174.1 hypothetical protein GNI_184050 [Gregarina niphandrodes]|eukprot:XP_011133568.1 hypothetical protein GNI_184050 [Gregarina niphandrodes]